MKLIKRVISDNKSAIKVRQKEPKQTIKNTAEVLNWKTGERWDAR